MNEVSPNYRQTARDRQIDARRSTPALHRVKPFVISRPMSKESSVKTRFPNSKPKPERYPETFTDLLCRIPEYSDYAIPVIKGRSPRNRPDMWLLNRNMVSEVIDNPQSKMHEQKKVNKAGQSIVDYVNGLGSGQIVLTHEMLTPLVISTPVGFMGYLAVRRETETYQALKSANERALTKLESFVPGDYDEYGIARRSLEPWIKLVNGKEKDVAQQVVEGFHEAMEINEVSLIMDAARPLFAR